MDFLSFLRALSLEPADNSNIKMTGIVRFQGNLIATTELGHELPRLLNDDRMDYQDADGIVPETNNGHGVSIFEGVKLPELDTPHYLSRELEHKVILFPKGGSTWKALELELLRRLQSEERESGIEDGDVGRREIFAVSWSKSNTLRNACNEESLQTGGNEREDGCDYKVLKVSELLNWSSKRNHRHYDSDDDNPGMDVGFEERVELDVGTHQSKLDKEMQVFMDPWVKPPGDAKLRLVELDDMENPDDQFTKLCNSARLFTVHWFQAFNHTSGFAWKRTHGPLKVSRLQLTDVSYREANLFENLEHKAWQNIICISGVAGMGKTTLLIKIAHELKQMYKTRLICFIDLKKLSSLIDKMNLVYMDILKFSELILQYFNINSELEKNIFKCLMNTFVDNKRIEPKVELLMDGFDLMLPRTRNLLQDFLKEELSLCDKWSYRVWITTRPHLQYQIEDAFSIVAYELCKLDHTDTSDYFRMCRSQDQTSMPDLGTLAKTLFAPSLAAYLKIDLSTLLCIPERMVAFEAYLKLKRYPDPFTLTATNIMRDVIMKSAQESYIKGYLEAGESSTDVEDHIRLVNDIISKHISMALRVCSGEIGGPTEGIDLRTLSSEEESELLGFGIVSQDKHGKFYFIHASYPAYILADHYHRHPPDNSVRSDFFLNCVLMKDACDLIRQFYDEMWTNGMQQDISQEWSHLVRDFLIKTYYLSNNKYNHDRVHTSTSVLDLAIIDQRLKLTKFIIRSFWPYHTFECRRLIKRKVKVLISDICPQKNKPRNCNLTKYSMMGLEGSLSGKKRNSKSDKNESVPKMQYIELSTLSLAIMFGDGELVKIMYSVLGEEVYPHVKKFTKNDNARFSPLHLAVIGCNSETFKFLTAEKGTSPNYPDARGFLPIHLIFINRWILNFPPMGLGNLDIEAEVLREVHIRKFYHDDTSDPDWNVRVGQVSDRAGNKPLLSSSFVTDYAKKQMKMSLNFINKYSDRPWKICYYKSYKTYIDIVESLSGRTFINFRKKVVGRHARAKPPFHLACAAGHIPMIRKMLEKKAVKLNIRDHHNRTALFTALCKEQMHVVKYLIDQGIDIDIHQKITGVPLLHHLSGLNLNEATRFVIQELNVPVDLRDAELDNSTPLQLACINGCLEAAKTLVELGANVNTIDEEQLTPLLHAVHPSSTSCNLDLVKFLISAGADVNAGCDKEEGRTCLHFAVMANNLPLIQCLLETAKDRLNVNAVTAKGQSALHLACKQTGNLSMLQILVSAGAEVDLKDAKGETPLFVFCEENHSDTTMGVFLIRHGANVYQVNNCGQSLLRELSKRNPTLSETFHGAWKTVQNQKAFGSKREKLNLKKFAELSL